MNIFDSLQAQLGNQVKAKVNLAPYTTFKLGGPAEYYFVAETKQELIDAYHIAQKLDIQFNILGGASNIVVPEEGINGLVVRNMVSYKKIIEKKDDSVLLEVGSGYSITRLAKETSEEGLSGIEFHLGLPGTIGGAVVMNSKWTRPRVDVGDYVYSVEVIKKDGTVKVEPKDYCEFSYGWSKLQQTKEIVVAVTLELKKIGSEVSVKNAQDSLAYRKETQPFGVFTSGCFFKNVDNLSAGKLIDDAGLKGYSVGDLVVSDKHANFIINKGNGNVKDLRKLLDIIKTKVKEHSGIELKEEVIILNY